MLVQFGREGACAIDVALDEGALEQSPVDAEVVAEIAANGAQHARSGKVLFHFRRRIAPYRAQRRGLGQDEVELQLRFGRPCEFSQTPRARSADIAMASSLADRAIAAPAPRRQNLIASRGASPSE